MLPYIEQPVLDLGFYRIEAFPVLVGAALITQFQIVMRRAPGQGISRELTSSLLAWTIGLGLLGAHLFDLLVYYPEQLVQDPWVLLRPWEGISSFGGMLGGLSGMFLLMHRWSMPAADRWRFVDCLIFALPFTLAIGRLGCALQHDHLGVFSTHPLAVRFPGGARFDLGLLEFLYVTLMCGVFLAADRRRWPPGFYLGLFFALYGPVRFALDALRIGDARYLGWTPGQYLSLLGTGAGIALLAWLFSRPTEEPGEA